MIQIYILPVNLIIETIRTYTYECRQTTKIMSKTTNKKAVPDLWLHHIKTETLMRKSVGKIVKGEDRCLRCLRKRTYKRKGDAENFHMIILFLWRPKGFLSLVQLQAPCSYMTPFNDETGLKPLVQIVKSLLVFLFRNCFWTLPSSYQLDCIWGEKDL